jgi:hypothetical protein
MRSKVVVVEGSGWLELREGEPERSACKVTLPRAIAWRVVTKGIARDSARPQVEIEGDEALADGIVGLTAIFG